MLNQFSGGIQDFPEGGAPTPKVGLFFQLFAENCMKMKEFGRGGDASLVPPLDPPMQFVKYTLGKKMKNIELWKIW